MVPFQWYLLGISYFPYETTPAVSHLTRSLRSFRYRGGPEIRPVAGAGATPQLHYDGAVGEAMGLKTSVLGGDIDSFFKKLGEKFWEASFR